MFNQRRRLTHHVSAVSVDRPCRSTEPLQLSSGGRGMANRPRQRPFMRRNVLVPQMTCTRCARNAGCIAVDPGYSQQRLRPEMAAAVMGALPTRLTPLTENHPQAYQPGRSRVQPHVPTAWYHLCLGVEAVRLHALAAQEASMGYVRHWCAQCFLKWVGTTAH